MSPEFPEFRMGVPWATMIRRDFLNSHAMRFIEGVAFEDNLWSTTIQSRAERVAYTPKQSYYYRWTPGSILSDMSFPKKIWRINSYVRVFEELWLIEDSETPQRALLFKRMAAREGRTFLARLAELGSFRRRIAISRELRKRGFLARLFRDAETGMHRKRILRVYWFAWLGEIAEFLRLKKNELSNN